MHWVLVYFLSYYSAINHYGYGGVGQIRFKTKPACEIFYAELESKYKPKKIAVDGVCMKWQPGVEHRVEHFRK